MGRGNKGNGWFWSRNGSVRFPFVSGTWDPWEMNGYWLVIGSDGQFSYILCIGVYVTSGSLLEKFPLLVFFA